VAAAIAAGESVSEAGDPLDPDELEVLELPLPYFDGETLVAHVLLIDVYGNVTLDVHHENLPGTSLTLGRTIEVAAGDRKARAIYTTTFADLPPGELLLYQDSSRTLALAVNRGDAATTLGVEPDDEVRLTPS
jgi:S-adenosylmethionine hydrolase